MARATAWAAAALALGVASGAAAQERNLTLLGIPSATVAPGGIGYVALSGTPDSAASDDVDGSLELGFGLGSAEDGLGVQLKGVVTSLTDNFGDAGYLGVKLSHRLAAGAMPLYLGLEVEEFGGWGESSRNDTSGSLMLTGFGRVGPGAMPVMVTVGITNHQRDDETRPFAGIGAGFTPWLGGSVAWTGETLDLGLSLRPGADSPFRLNATLSDAGDRFDDRRLSFSAAWIFNTGLAR